MTTDVPEIYTQDYRHFDNLIWQVPAWATALFSLATTAAVLALANADKVEKSMPIDVPHTVAAFVLSVFVILLLLAIVFIKFRLHQSNIYRSHRIEVPKRWFLPSAQACLLFILLLEAAIMLALSLLLFGLPTLVVQVVASVFLVLSFCILELTVLSIRCEIKKTRSSKNAG
jgi:hypothetical protein